MYKNNEKKTVWLYAVILFTSAFIVLLLTGYSQIKFNKSLTDYKNRLNDREKENTKFQYNLSSALAENKKMNEELKSLKEDMLKTIEKNNSLSKNVEDIKNNQTITISSYELLLKADKEYSEGNIRESALILLEKINIYQFSENALNKYYELVSKTYKKAALQFYRDGLKDYKKGEYEKAVKDLKYSLKFAKNEYFSDDCYYFIGYSEYNLGNKDLAKESLETLISNYPDSSYKKDAEDLLTSINGQ